MPRISAEQRREDFIAAAISVIAVHGVEGATTRRIAEQAGAPLARLHYCFSSKEDLFAAIYESMMATMLSSVLVIREGAGLGRTAATMVRQLAEWWLRELPSRVVELELFLWTSRTDDVAARRNYEAYHQLIRAKLREGMRPDDDPTLLDPLTRMVMITADGMTPWLQVHGDLEKERLAMVDVVAESVERLAESRRLR